MIMRYLITRLLNEHIKKDFNSGNPLLDNYLKTQAKQDVNRDLSACFVLIDDNNVVKGFYTLSASSVNKEMLPVELAKKLPPSYQTLPTILLGRLACDKSIKGQGYGEALLMNALKRSVQTSESVGSLALVVDPIDDQSKSFYKRYGFILLSGTGKMLLPMKTIKSSYIN